MDERERIEHLRAMQKEQKDRVLLYNRLILKEYMGLFFNEEEGEQPEEKEAADT